MSNRLCVIGSGFVGRHFIQHSAKHFETITSTSNTSPKPQHSHQHIFLNIYDNAPLPKLGDHDIFIVTIPFSRQLKAPEDYEKGIQKLVPQLKNKKVIFTSSTSVYSNNGHCTEDTPTAKTRRSKALVNVENLLLNISESAYILRLGGICGKQRSSQHKRQSTLVSHANARVNLIHIDDIILVMHKLCQKEFNNKDIINIVCTDHPTRQDYYQYICDIFNDPYPTFTSSDQSFKTVSNKKLINLYNVNLKFPSPLSFQFS
ncbi:MAG: hypothetical protein ACON35_06265 [Candidatus Marinamargulisbacteria bacterium]